VENSRPAAAVVPLDGSAPIRALGTLIIASGTGILTWNQDGTRLIASTNERFNLWSYGLDGGEPRRLTGFADEILIRGALTPDGRHIVASRGTFHRDPYTITGFK
jgi:Tol biopolymer transport system component